MKRLAILGSTGSIGTSTLDVVAAHPDQFEVVALAAGNNVDLMEQQVRRFRPRFAALADEAGAHALARRLGSEAPTLAWGTDGVRQAAAETGADTVVSAIVGGAGLVPTMAALRAGKTLALANKETLVMAGELVTAAARARGTRILPVDSEHSAIFQCLENGETNQVRRIILTASGGPFRTLPKEAFARITPEDALRHPTWSMGRKITIDSATLVNKGLEVIEAQWLFGLPLNQVDVIVHPQSVIHSMVEYLDGSILAQLGSPDMRLPIQYALTYPARRVCPATRLDLERLSSMTFEPVDRTKFPCLDLAYEAARAGGSWPSVLNAANEVAVQWFLDRRIGFDEIPEILRKAMDAHPRRAIHNVEDVLEVDRQVREHLTGR
jgi:1-deoxy-D-xylulose-5-phosphate reductoisomerase